MTRGKKATPLLGAHTSAAGGSFNALIQGHDIGATCIQIFTSNQKQWKGRSISEKEVEKWFSLREEYGISHVMSHASYLINLGSPKAELLEKSRAAFRAEIERCQLLKIDYLNFHPGAATTDTKERCLDTIVASLLEYGPLLKKGSTRLLLEATAGQGTCVGSSFDELGYIIKKVYKKIPIGVCIDTCHIFAAGYDIHDKKGWEETLKEFDKKVGLEHLYALHLNDSVHPCGSRKDRHALLGKGEIGIESFKFIMQSAKLRDLPKYLETPNPDEWPREIKMLMRFAKGE